MNKGKPILFSTEMVRAILNGRKTMTRRVIKGANPKWEFDSLSDGACITGVDKHGNEYAKDVDGIWACFEATDEYYTDFAMFKSKYEVGDILWVRETWCCYDTEIGICYWYKADFNKNEIQPKWKPSIFMPKEAARIFLRVTDVRVERLQDISEEDTKSEGVTLEQAMECGSEYFIPNYYNPDNNNPIPDYVAGYECLWNSINAKRDYSWDMNPWVLVITFEQIDGVKS